MDISNLEMNLFRESNGNVLNQLLHSCADKICGYPGPTYQLFANNMNWTEDDYNCAYGLFSSLLRTPGALYLDTEKMPQIYHDLPESVQTKVLTCLRVRQEQLTSAILKEYSKKHGPTMIDFDWRLKLVMGSSKLVSLREPLLQLDLAVEEKNDKRILGLELDKQELDSLINALESLVK